MFNSFAIFIESLDLYRLTVGSNAASPLLVQNTYKIYAILLAHSMYGVFYPLPTLVLYEAYHMFHLNFIFPSSVRYLEAINLMQIVKDISLDGATDTRSIYRFNQLRMSFYTHRVQPLTSLYHKAAIDASRHNKLLVFIPGNPGLIDYYTTYLELIQKRYPVLEILNISHAGFQTTDDYITKGERSPFVFYDLNFQINHKVDIITEFVDKKWKENGAQDGKIELFFLCHSVGAFISQRVIKKLLETPEISKKISIKFVGLICPTILDIKISSSGKLFTRLFRLLPIIRVVLFWTRILKWMLSPQKIKNIVRYHLGKKKATDRTFSDPDATANMENSIIATYNLVLSQRIIKQALTLAEEEMEEISQHDAINDFFFKTLTNADNRVKIWSFFADNDYWVHDNTRDSILTQYTDADNKNLNFQLGKPSGITHSFCVDQNKEFAEITIQALGNFFDDKLD